MLGSPVTCVLVSCQGQASLSQGLLAVLQLSQSVAQQAGQGFQLKHNDPLAAAAATLTTLSKCAVAKDWADGQPSGRAGWLA